MSFRARLRDSSALAGTVLAAVLIAAPAFAQDAQPAPQTDEEWTRVKRRPMAIVEAGNLMMIPAPSGGNDEWNQRALELIAQSKRVVPAADTHDKQGVFDRGADMYDACVNCHKQFDPAIRDAK